MNDLRLELRIKNNRLYSLIFESFGSVAEFSRAVGIPAVVVGDLLNLKEWARKKSTSRAGTGKGEATQDYREPVLKICEYFKELPEDIFPDDIYGIKSSKLVTTVPLSVLRIEENKKPILLEENTKSIMREDLKTAINELLKTIPTREAEVIRMRFGLNGYKEKAIKDISDMLGVSKERVRQIEAKALRRLRNPERSKNLAEFYEFPDEE